MDYLRTRAVLSEHEITTEIERSAAIGVTVRLIGAGKRRASDAAASGAAGS